MFNLFRKIRRGMQAQGYSARHVIPWALVLGGLSFLTCFPPVQAISMGALSTFAAILLVSCVILFGLKFAAFYQYGAQELAILDQHSDPELVHELTYSEEMSLAVDDDDILLPSDSTVFSLSLLENSIFPPTSPPSLDTVSECLQKTCNVI